jgi:hypothetical protein
MGTACVFPFTYTPYTPLGKAKTVTYTRCTDVGTIKGLKAAKPWCSLVVDEQGKHISAKDGSKNYGDCSETCTGQCGNNCAKCDMMTGTPCSLCANSTYLHNSSCVDTCPNGFKGFGAAQVGRICKKVAAGRLLAETSSAGQTLTPLKAGTTNATLANGYKVTAFMVNSTTTSLGSLTHATALLGKSLDGGKTVTWLVEQQAWFPADSKELFGSVRDASISLSQSNDGTAGSCDKSQAAFCLYGLVYSKSCPLGEIVDSKKCKPAEITCKVPVIYRTVAQGSKGGANATLFITINATTGETTKVNLIGGDQVIIPKANRGSITPAVWRTKVKIGNFHKEKEFVSLQTDFDWDRKVDVNLFPAMQGQPTYLALVGIDEFSQPSAVVAPAPAYTSRGKAPPSSVKCIDAKSAQVKVTGTMKFAVEGLLKVHVEEAAKTAIARSLGVSPTLVTVSANKEVSSGRRLAADSWAVSYEVVVPEARAVAVEKAAKAASTDSTAFTKELVTSLETVAVSAGVAFEPSSVTVSAFTAPTKAEVTVTKPTVTQPAGSTAAPRVTKPTVTKPEVKPGDKPSGATTTVTTTIRARQQEGAGGLAEGVVDASASLLLSSAVAGLVMLVGSM